MSSETHPYIKLLNGFRFLVVCLFKQERIMKNSKPNFTLAVGLLASGIIVIAGISEVRADSYKVTLAPGQVNGVSNDGMLVHMNQSLYYRSNLSTPATKCKVWAPDGEYGSFFNSLGSYLHDDSDWSYHEISLFHDSSCRFQRETMFGVNNIMPLAISDENTYAFAVYYFEYYFAIYPKTYVANGSKQIRITAHEAAGFNRFMPKVIKKINGETLLAGYVATGGEINYPYGMRAAIVNIGISGTQTLTLLPSPWLNTFEECEILDWRGNILSGQCKDQDPFNSNRRRWTYDLSNNTFRHFNQAKNTSGNIEIRSTGDVLIVESTNGRDPNDYYYENTINEYKANSSTPEDTIKSQIEKKVGKKIYALHLIDSSRTGVLVVRYFTQRGYNDSGYAILVRVSTNLQTVPSDAEP